MFILKFSLSNPVTNILGSLSFNKFIISFLTSSDAVAVNAVIIGLSTSLAINVEIPL